MLCDALDLRVYLCILACLAFAKKEETGLLKPCFLVHPSRFMDAGLVVPRHPPFILRSKGTLAGDRLCCSPSQTSPSSTP